MVKQDVAKKYVVNYKPLNAVLKKKKRELEKIHKLVTFGAKVDISLQIEAMNLLLGKCKSGNMSKSYNAKSLRGKMSDKTCK